MDEIRGSCHCGALRTVFSPSRPLADLPWRRCGCGFCRRHGGVYTSDPQGRLRVEAQSGALTRYTFGQRTADFLICTHCGVFVAVTAEIDGIRRGVVNVMTADPPLIPPSEIPVMDFEGETVEARTDRRRRGWIGAVDIVEL